MRKKLGLFANIRPVQTFKCLVHKSPLKDEIVSGADFVCIRELTGGMYFGEKYQDDNKAYDTNYYTREEVERILRVAYDYAMKRRRHLTVVDKANVEYVAKGILGNSGRGWPALRHPRGGRMDSGLYRHPLTSRQLPRPSPPPHRSPPPSTSISTKATRQIWTKQSSKSVNA